jgi:hypothetical protein
MGFLKKIFGIEPSLPKLVSANITFDEDFNFNVAFVKEHPQLENLELVRLVLHYYAKTMLNLGNKSTGVVALFEGMNTVVRTGIDRATDVLYVADIDDTVNLVEFLPASGARKISATLYFVDEMRRGITTQIPFKGYEQDLVFSVFALLQTALNHLDDYWIACLHRALQSMNSAYSRSSDFSSFSASEKIPNDAFISATLEALASVISAEKSTQEQPAAVTSPKASKVKSGLVSEQTIEKFGGDLVDFVASLARELAHTTGSQSPSNAPNASLNHEAGRGIDRELLVTITKIILAIRVYLELRDPKSALIDRISMKDVSQHGEALLDFVIRIALEEYSATDSYNVRLLEWITKD